MMLAFIYNCLHLFILLIFNNNLIIYFLTANGILHVIMLYKDIVNEQFPPVINNITGYIIILANLERTISCIGKVYLRQMKSAYLKQL